MTAHAKHVPRWLLAGALLGGLAPGLAFADPVRSDEAIALPELANTQQATQQPANDAAMPLAQAPITGEALDAFRGGSEIAVTNKSHLDGVVSDNYASNLTTGSNLITDGSFAGANGYSTVIQNSGNNVLIQDSTIVNLQLK